MLVSLRSPACDVLGAPAGLLDAHHSWLANASEERPCRIKNTSAGKLRMLARAVAKTLTLMGHWLATILFHSEPLAISVRFNVCPSAPLIRSETSAGDSFCVVIVDGLRGNFSAKCVARGGGCSLRARRISFDTVLGRRGRRRRYSLGLRLSRSNSIVEQG